MSNLRTVAEALAGWDLELDQGQPAQAADLGPEHWAGARTVLDALQPKFDTATQLDALPVGSTVWDSSRDGPTIYARSDRGWWCPMSRGKASSYRVTTANILGWHPHVRLLWRPI